MYMTDQEIATSYRLARDRRQQIGVLAELNACDRAEIVAILERVGEKMGKARRGRQHLTKTEEAEFKRLCIEGKSKTEIASALAISVEAVNYRLRKLGAPQRKARRAEA